MKTNMDKLLELLKETTENLKESNNKFIQVTLTMFCDITRELSQKIKEATSETQKSKTPREIFTQPQVKSALKMFIDQLDWINKQLENFMEDNKLSVADSKAMNGSTSRAVDDKKQSLTSKLSFKSKK